MTHFPVSLSNSLSVPFNYNTYVRVSVIWLVGILLGPLVVIRLSVIVHRACKSSQFTSPWFKWLKLRQKVSFHINATKNNFVSIRDTGMNLEIISSVQCKIQLQKFRLLGNFIDWTLSKMHWVLCQCKF